MSTKAIREALEDLRLSLEGHPNTRREHWERYVRARDEVDAIETGTPQQGGVIGVGQQRQSDLRQTLGAALDGKRPEPEKATVDPRHVRAETIEEVLGFLRRKAEVDGTDTVPLASVIEDVKSLLWMERNAWLPSGVSAYRRCVWRYADGKGQDAGRCTLRAHHDGGHHFTKMESK